jgi:hypothetical protein
MQLVSLDNLIINKHINYPTNYNYVDLSSLQALDNKLWGGASGGAYVGKNPKIEKSDFEDQKCAPAKKFDNNSCFTLVALKEMAHAFNTFVYMKIIKDKKPITISDDKLSLIEQLDDRLQDICDDQLCWIEQDFMNIVKKKRPEIHKDILENTFRPEGPEGRFTWLSTTDIDNILKQYHFHKDFKFLGTVPIDFDDLPALGIKDLNFDQLYKDGIHKIGIVFNTDEHYKSGTHWIGLYADLKKCQIYFSDSYARVPDDRIREFVRRIALWCAKKHLGFKGDADAKFMMKDRKNNVERLPGMDIRYNQTRHQYKDSECGIYSLNFILWLLEGKTFDQYIAKPIPDDEINEFRKVYFRYN